MSASRTSAGASHADHTYHGGCFCGTVQIAVSGQPKAAGYCHCTSCRTWSAAPVNAFTLWDPADVRIVRGSEQVGTFNKTPHSARKWCKACGGHVLTEHPGMGLIDVYAATIPAYPFQPALHVNYQESVMHIHDGLAKLKDMPKEMGGSGTVLPE